jgi:hypothetical protein
VRCGRVAPRPKEEAFGSCVDPARRRLCTRGRVSSREGACAEAFVCSEKEEALLANADEEATLL